MANMGKRAIAACVGLLGALGLGGCGSNPARIFFTWEVQLSDGTPSSCAAGDTVEIQAGTVVDSNIPCSAMGFTTGSVPAGTYTVTVSLIDVNGTVLSTTPIPNSVIASGVTNDIGHVIFQIGGAASFTWSLRMNGAPVTCAAGEQVVIDFVTVSPAFPCTAMAATVGVPEGNYDVVVSLVDSTNTVESQTPVIPVDVTAGQTTVVAPILFTL